MSRELLYPKPGKAKNLRRWKVEKVGAGIHNDVWYYRTKIGAKIGAYLDYYGTGEIYLTDQWCTNTQPSNP